MRRVSAMVLAAVSLLLPAVVCAQEELTSEQLRRMYDDALSQMKTAQDRRNELARENEKLRAHIAELEKQVDLAKSQSAALAVTLDNTYRQRSEAAAIRDFLRLDPDLNGQWLAFLQTNQLPSFDGRGLLDADWPFYAIKSADHH